MKNFLKNFAIIISLLFVFLENSYADIDKINTQLKSIESLYDAKAMDKEEYEKIRSRLLKKKKRIRKT